MKKNLKIILITALIAFNTVLCSTLWAQKKIEIEDVWQKYSFYPAQTADINWMKDGQFYSANEGKKISNSEWIKILHKNPILIERPILVKDGKALIGRPIVRVLELFKE